MLIKFWPLFLEQVSPIFPNKKIDDTIRQILESLDRTNILYLAKLLHFIFLKSNKKLQHSSEFHEHVAYSSIQTCC